MSNDASGNSDGKLLFGSYPDGRPKFQSEQATIRGSVTFIGPIILGTRPGTGRLTAWYKMHLSLHSNRLTGRAGAFLFAQDRPRQEDGGVEIAFEPNHAMQEAMPCDDVPCLSRAGVRTTGRRARHNPPPSVQALPVPPITAASRGRIHRPNEYLIVTPLREGVVLRNDQNHHFQSF